MTGPILAIITLLLAVYAIFRDWKHQVFGWPLWVQRPVILPILHPEPTGFLPRGSIVEHDYSEAHAALLAGKRVLIKSQPQTYLTINDGVIYRCGLVDFKIYWQPRQKDLLRSDWVIL